MNGELPTQSVAPAKYVRAARVDHVCRGGGTVDEAFMWLAFCTTLPGGIAWACWYAVAFDTGSGSGHSWEPLLYAGWATVALHVLLVVSVVTYLAVVATARRRLDRLRNRRDLREVYRDECAPERAFFEAISR